MSRLRRDVTAALLRRLISAAALLRRLISAAALLRRLISASLVRRLVTARRGRLILALLGWLGTLGRLLILLGVGKCVVAWPVVELDRRCRLLGG